MGLNRDKSLFYYAVANMIDAGASTISAMRQGFPRRIRPIAIELYNAMDMGGVPLSTAMSSHSIFTPFECMLVTIGEQSGMLPQVMKTLAEWFESKNHLEKSIIMGLVYPMLIYYVAGPLLAIIEAVSSQMQCLHHVIAKLILWWLAPIVLWIAWKALSPILKRNSLLGGILDCVPFFGNLRFAAETSYFMRALGMCLNAGMGISNAMNLACNVCTNEMYRRHYARISRIVQTQRCTLSEAFARELTSRERHSSILDFIRLGEETGTLPEQCERLAKLYQEEHAQKIGIFTKLFPVAVYLVIAIFLAFKIISIFSSYIGMINSL